MFDHVTIRVADRGGDFYRTVPATLGIEPAHVEEGFAERGDFSLAAADGDRPVTRRLHIGFGAPSRAHVDAFWEAGMQR